MDPDFHRDSLLENAFSFRTALSLARAADLAYEDDSETLGAVIADWGMKPAVIFSHDETEGFIARDDELVVLAFRGTVSITDWLRNLKIARREVEMGKVHGGFHEGLEAVWADHVEPTLREAADSGHKVWITGHSLGGALATLAAAWCHEWLDVAGVYTFGQPLVGNRSFARLFNSKFHNRFHRFVNASDIVPKVPPAPLFAHVDQRVRFDKEGDIIEESSSRDLGEEEIEAMSEEEFEEIQRLLEVHEYALDEDEDGARGLLPNLPFMSGISDHNMGEGYIPKLRKSAESETS